MRKFILLIIIILSSSLQAIDYTISPNTYSIQSGDFDNDGDDDIVVGHTLGTGCISFLENEGIGEFVLIDTLSPFGSNLVHGIINLDDNDTSDIVFDGQNDTSQLLYIIYNDDFSTIYSYSFNLNAPVHSLSFGDFDGDSDYDLVFSSSGASLDNLWGVMYNLGDREFSEPEWVECPNQALNADFIKFVCYDLDNNAFDDIIAYSFADTYVYYFSEDGFTVDSLGYQNVSSGMTSADYDLDGDYDIVITHWPIITQDNFKLYENTGTQNFTLHNYFIDTLWGNPVSCKINSDGLIDIVTVGDEIKKYFNESNLQFSEVSIQDYPDYGESWVKSSFSDFDNNGTQDVAIIRYGIEENNLTILFNDGDGNFLEEPVSVDNYELPISNYELNNYPNPFNPETTIYFETTNLHENTRIEIFNLKGQKIKEIPVTLSGVEGYDNSNKYSVIWLGKDDNNKKCSSGIYFYHLKVNGKSKSVKKCLLLK